MKNFRGPWYSCVLYSTTLRSKIVSAQKMEPKLLHFVSLKLGMWFKIIIQPPGISNLSFFKEIHILVKKWVYSRFCWLQIAVKIEPSMLQRPDFLWWAQEVKTSFSAKKTVRNFDPFSIKSIRCTKMTAIETTWKSPLAVLWGPWYM